MWNICFFSSFIFSSEALSEEIESPLLITSSETFILPVSAECKEASQFTVQGLNHIIFGWDEEAFQCFSAALEYDPNCFLAHWGLIFSAFGSDHTEELKKSLKTIKLLAEKNTLPPPEDSYCNILALLIGEGRTSAVEALEKHCRQFRRDTFAVMLRIVLLRSGFDFFDNPLPDQKTAVSLAESLIERNPGNAAAYFLRAWLEESAPSVTERAVECATLAAKKLPAYAPILHLNGIMQFRSQHYKTASSFFERSAAYALHESSKYPVADRDLYLKSLLFLSVSQSKNGEKKSALKTRNFLRSIPIDLSRPYARGSRLQIWEVRSLPSRNILSDHGIPDERDIKACMSSFNPLPKGINDPTETYASILKHCMESRLLFATKKASGLLCLKKAEEELKILKAESALSQNAPYRSQFERACEAAKVILLNTRSLYSTSPEDWNEDAKEIAKPGSDFLPPATL